MSYTVTEIKNVNFHCSNVSEDENLFDMNRIHLFFYLFPFLIKKFDLCFLFSRNDFIYTSLLFSLDTSKRRYFFVFAQILVFHFSARISSSSFFFVDLLKKCFFFLVILSSDQRHDDYMNRTKEIVWPNFVTQMPLLVVLNERVCREIVLIG